MVGPINTLNVAKQTTATDLANTFGQDTAKLYAKDTGQGRVLYTKTGSSLADKITLTKGPDGTVMSKAKAKRMLAEQTVSQIVKKGVGKRLTAMTQGPGAMNKKVIAEARILTVKNVRAQFVPGENAQTMVNKAKTMSDNAQTLLTRLEQVSQAKTQNQGLVQKAQPHQMPPTTNHEAPGQKLVHKGVELPPLDIGGRIFEPVKVLGDASNLVALYRLQGATGPNAETIAVKVPKNDSEQLQQEFIAEYKSATAFVNGSPHLGGFRDIVQIADGRVLLIGDVVPNGDLDGLSNTLSSVALPRGAQGPVPSGKITAEQRDLIVLTMIRDMLTGLQQIHEGATPGIHRDMKPQNVMIDGSGRGVVVDLGAAITEDKYRPLVHKQIDQALYMAPEVAKAQVDFHDVTTVQMRPTRTGIEDAFKAIYTQLNKPGVDISDKLSGVRKFVTDDVQTAANRNAATIQTDARMDIWGTGLVALQLALGRNIEAALGLAGAFQDKREKIVADLPNTHDKILTVGTEALGPRTVMQGTGNAQLDTLINELLSIDPNTRPTASDLLTRTTGLLADPRVGDQKVRDLIVAIKSGDPGRIDTARDKL